MVAVLYCVVLAAATQTAADVREVEAESLLWQLKDSYDSGFPTESAERLRTLSPLPKSAVPALLELLDSDRPYDVAAVIEALGAIGPDAALATERLAELAVMSAAHDERHRRAERPRTELAAISALRKIGPPPNGLVERVVRRHQFATMAPLIDEEYSASGEKATTLLWKKEAAAALVRLLSDPDGEVRYQVGQWLRGPIGGYAAKEIVTKFAASPKNWVLQELVVRRSGYLAESTCAPEVEKQLRQLVKSRDNTIRFSSACALAWVHKTDGVSWKALREAMVSGKKGEREAAVVALAQGAPADPGFAKTLVGQLIEYSSRAGTSEEMIHWHLV